MKAIAFILLISGVFSIIMSDLGVHNVRAIKAIEMALDRNNNQAIESTNLSKADQAKIKETVHGSVMNLEDAWISLFRETDRLSLYLLLSGVVQSMAGVIIFKIGKKKSLADEST